MYVNAHAWRASQAGNEAKEDDQRYEMLDSEHSDGTASRVCECINMTSNVTVPLSWLSGFHPLPYPAACSSLFILSHPSLCLLPSPSLRRLLNSHILTRTLTAMLRLASTILLSRTPSAQFSSVSSALPPIDSSSKLSPLSFPLFSALFSSLPLSPSSQVPQ